MKVSQWFWIAWDCQLEFVEMHICAVDPIPLDIMGTHTVVGEFYCVEFSTGELDLDFGVPIPMGQACFQLLDFLAPGMHFLVMYLVGTDLCNLEDLLDSC